MKIGFFIEPEGDVAATIQMWKRRVEETFGDQPYLSHPPHLTLFTMDVSEETCPPANEEVARLCHQMGPFDMTFLGPKIFYDDALTDGHTLVFEVECTPELLTTQSSLLTALQSFRDTSARPDTSAYNTWMKENVSNYGFPFVGDGWIPHMTIASIRRDCDSTNVMDAFMDSACSFTQRVQSFSSWHIVGDHHTQLNKWKLE